MDLEAHETQSKVTAHFDHNVSLYVDRYAASYAEVCRDRLGHLAKYLPHAEDLTVLDIGCGAGVFTDGLLARFGQARAFCVDRSLRMLARNTSQTRKDLICGDARALPFEASSFDVINVDALMHHLVNPGGYRKSISAIADFLRALRNFVRPEGTLAVREIFHESVGVAQAAPRLIYWLSVAPWPAICRTALRKHGLMTAGVGVVFLTRGQWAQIFRLSGWAVLDTVERPWPRMWKAPGLKSGDLYYVCRPTGEKTRGTSCTRLGESRDGRSR